MREAMLNYTGGDGDQLNREMYAAALAARDAESIEVEFRMAHDSFPPLTGVNIPEYDNNEFCILTENLKLDPQVVNNWLVEKQEAGATILAITLHFAPKFDTWEVFIVYSEPWDG